MKKILTIFLIVIVVLFSSCCEKQTKMVASKYDFKKRERYYNVSLKMVQTRTVHYCIVVANDGSWISTGNKTYNNVAVGDSLTSCWKLETIEKPKLK